MQVIEYQNAETEFAVAAAELEHNQTSNGASGEAKQDSNSSAVTRELVELKVLLGKVSSERDELREETTRLRRIASTLTAPSAPTTAGTATSTSGAPAGVRVVAKRGTTVASKAATPAAAASASGSRVAGQKEKQQAATNVLVIELNAEVLTY